MPLGEKVLIPNKFVIDCNVTPTDEIGNKETENVWFKIQSKFVSEPTVFALKTHESEFLKTKK